jgi:methyl-accepting chemotaxis protein
MVWEKNYFWINDTHSIMIMHSYRRDLVGRDVTNTRDPEGKKMFQAFLETAKAKDGGYVSYHYLHGDRDINVECQPRIY